MGEATNANGVYYHQMAAPINLAVLGPSLQNAQPMPGGSNQPAQLLSAEEKGELKKIFDSWQKKFELAGGLNWWMSHSPLRTFRDACDYDNLSDAKDYLNDRLAEAFNRFMSESQAPSSSKAASSNAGGGRKMASTSKGVGLFGNTGLSAEDRAILMEGADADEDYYKKRDARRAEAQRPFDDSDGQASGYQFTFGGNQGGRGNSSARRHVTEYAQQYGLPSGVSMDDVRTNLLEAAAILVAKGTLGHKGAQGMVTIKRGGLTFRMIIEHLGGKKYSIEHADLGRY